MCVQIPLLRIVENPNGAYIQQNPVAADKIGINANITTAIPINRPSTPPKANKPIGMRHNPQTIRIPRSHQAMFFVNNINLLLAFFFNSSVHNIIVSTI
jgi:hypothetical protein